MKQTFALSLVLASMLTATVNAEATLDCKTGPARKTFGGTEWLVYSCADGDSILVVTAEGSPAMPFLFIITPTNIHGEGTGNQAATDAAYADLEKLTNADIQNLIKETQAVAP